MCAHCMLLQFLENLRGYEVTMATSTSLIVTQGDSIYRQLKRNTIISCHVLDNCSHVRISASIRDH